MREDYDPLLALFEAACLSDSGAGDSTIGGNGSNAQKNLITSESQWRTFANSLAAEGLVVEQHEQQQLQKMWDRAVVRANSFGKKAVPSLSIRDVHHCVDEMYRDDFSSDIDLKINNAQESATELRALLDAWNMQSFNPTQIRQALQVVRRLEASHRKSVDGLRKEQDKQERAFIVESVLRLIEGTDPSQGGRPDGGISNPLVWQATNAGLVDQKVAKLRVQSIRYPEASHGFLNHSGRHGHGYGGAENDPWGVSQGLAGSHAISCRQGCAKRPNCSGEFPVGMGYPPREKLWRAFLAHRQLALGSCVMRSLGVADRDPEETLFYFEHARARPASVLLSCRKLQEGDLLFRHWARGTLVCLAQLSEQSTYSLERRISTANLMIGAQGGSVRLGGLRWGPEIHGIGQATDLALQQKDIDLCLGLADTLEGLLGLQPDGRTDETGANGVNSGLLHGTNEMKSGSRVGPSLMLVNILAWLRLPPRSRQGVTLKGLLGHQYFAPLRPDSIENDMPDAWKNFMAQAK
eukprot:g14708.t1